MSSHVVGETLEARRIYGRAFRGLLLRDWRVLRRQFFPFVLRVIMQPLLFVFVFAYVFPRIGQTIGDSTGKISFATILVPGLMAIAVFFQGISAVALPLVNEFSVTKEIEDRVMAPLPTSIVAIEKLIFGAVQSLLAASVVFPVVNLVAANEVSLQAHWPLVVAMVVMSSLAAGAMGLAIGTTFKPTQVPLIFSIIVIPVTFLGCVYYPWGALSSIRWLQVLVLLNPLVYVSEGLRGALTPQLDHLSPLVSFVALATTILTLGYIGVRGFKKQVIG